MNVGWVLRALECGTANTYFFEQENKARGGESVRVPGFGFRVLRICRVVLSGQGTLVGRVCHTFLWVLNFQTLCRLLTTVE